MPEALRSVLALFAALGLALWLSLPALADELDVQVRSIARDLQCPVCQGETVADSQSQLAQEMRALIRKKLQQGESREEIVRYFVDRYGEGILGAPPKRGAALIVWALPLAALVAGAAALALLCRAWITRGQPGGGPTAAAADDSPYSARLQAELRAFDEEVSEPEGPSRQPRDARPEVAPR